MPWTRRLDSGLWASSVRVAPGSTKRITKSHVSRAIVHQWAIAQESAIFRGDWIDPRLGRITVGEMWELHGDGRRLEKASRVRDTSHWRVHVGPRWADKAIGPIRKPDVSAWVVGMERAGTGGWTIIAALSLLRCLLEIAVDLRLIGFNPARGVKAPPPPHHEDRILTDHEAVILLDNLYDQRPGEAAAGLMCELMAYCGGRWEELAATRRTPEAIDIRRRLIRIRHVMERDGTIREYPKSRAGNRAVPVDDDLWPRLRAHVMSVEPGALLFTAPDGGPLDYNNWRKRIWKRGLLKRREMTADEAEVWKAERRAAGKRAWKRDWVVDEPILEDPQPTAHDLRHLYGTRLAEAGMVQHEIMSLMGHDDPRATARYLNAREERFDRAREAMSRFRRPRS